MAIVFDQNSSLENDTVYIYDKNWVLQAALSGTSMRAYTSTAPLIVSGDTIYVRLCTDNSRYGSGFKLTVFDNSTSAYMTPDWAKLRGFGYGSWVHYVLDSSTNTWVEDNHVPYTGEQLAYYYNPANSAMVGKYVWTDRVGFRFVSNDDAWWALDDNRTYTFQYAPNEFWNDHHYATLHGGNFTVGATPWATNKVVTEYGTDVPWNGSYNVSTANHYASDGSGWDGRFRVGYWDKGRPNDSATSANNSVRSKIITITAYNGLKALRLEDWFSGCRQDNVEYRHRGNYGTVWHTRGLLWADVTGLDLSDTQSTRRMFADDLTLTSITGTGEQNTVTTVVSSSTATNSTAYTLDTTMGTTSTDWEGDGKYGWHTNSLEDTTQMFFYDEKLDNLDMSSWDTRSVLKMGQMFAGDTSLKTMWVGEHTVFDKGTVDDWSNSDMNIISCYWESGSMINKDGHAGGYDSYMNSDSNKYNLYPDTLMARTNYAPTWTTSMRGISWWHFRKQNAQRVTLRFDIQSLMDGGDAIVVWDKTRQTILDVIWGGDISGATRTYATDEVYLSLYSTWGHGIPRGFIGNVTFDNAEYDWAWIPNHDTYLHDTGQWVNQTTGRAYSAGDFARYVGKSAIDAGQWVWTPGITSGSFPSNSYAWWQLDADGVLTIWLNDGASTFQVTEHNTGDSDADKLTWTVPWRTISNNIAGHVTAIKVQTDSAGNKIQPLNLDGWFDDMGSMVIADVANIDTSKATSAANMFRNDKSMVTLLGTGYDPDYDDEAVDKYLDPDYVSSSSVVGCPGWDTSRITNMDSMFDGCRSLTRLNMSTWDMLTSTPSTNNMLRYTDSLELMDLGPDVRFNPQNNAVTPNSIHTQFWGRKNGGYARALDGTVADKSYWEINAPAGSSAIVLDFNKQIEQMTSGTFTGGSTLGTGDYLVVAGNNGETYTFYSDRYIYDDGISGPVTTYRNQPLSGLDDNSILSLEFAGATQVTLRLYSNEDASIGNGFQVFVSYKVGMSPVASAALAEAGLYMWRRKSDQAYVRGVDSLMRTYDGSAAVSVGANMSGQWERVGVWVVHFETLAGTPGVTGTMDDVYLPAGESLILPGDGTYGSLTSPSSDYASRTGASNYFYRNGYVLRWWVTDPTYIPDAQDPNNQPTGEYRVGQTYPKVLKSEPGLETLYAIWIEAMDSVVEFFPGDSTDDPVDPIVASPAGTTAVMSSGEVASYYISYAPYMSGADVTVPAIPWTRLGYTFAGWQLEDADGNLVGVISPDGGLFRMANQAGRQIIDLSAYGLSGVTGRYYKLVATWEQKTGYTVTYDVKGGTPAKASRTNVAWNDTNLFGWDGVWPTKHGYRNDYKVMFTDNSGMDHVVTTTTRLGDLARFNGSDNVADTIVLWINWIERDASINFVAAGKGLISVDGSTDPDQINQQLIRTLVPCVSGSVSSVSGAVSTGYHLVYWINSLNTTRFYTPTLSAADIAAISLGPDGLYRSVTFTAVFAPNVYRVQFHHGTGTGVMDDLLCVYDVWTLAPVAAGSMSKPGYVFKEWNTALNPTGAASEVRIGEGDWFRNLTTVDGGVVTLYAQWEQSVVTYTFKSENSNGHITWTDGAGTHEASEHDFTAGVMTGTFDPVTAVAHDGYHFVSWIDEQTGDIMTTNPMLLLTKDNDKMWEYGRVYVARFAPNTYTVHYMYEGESTGGAMTEDYFNMTNQTFKYGIQERLTTIDDDSSTPAVSEGTKKSGYIFLGWKAYRMVGTVRVDRDGLLVNAQYVWNLATDEGDTVYLEARWSPAVYYIVYHDNSAPEGIYAGVMENQPIAYDDFTQTLTPNTFKRVGYDFAGWNDKPDGTGTLSFADADTIPFNLTSTPGDEIHLYAQWTIATYKVQLISDEMHYLYPVRNGSLNHADWGKLAGSLSQPGAVASPDKVQVMYEGLPVRDYNNDPVYAAIIESYWTYNTKMTQPVTATPTVITDANGNVVTMSFAYYTYEMTLADGTVYTGYLADPTTLTILGDTKFYVHWAHDSYTVIYDPGDHGQFVVAEGKTYWLSVPGGSATTLYYFYDNDKTNVDGYDTTETNIKNYGNPRAKSGWEFQYWQITLSDGTTYQLRNMGEIWSNIGTINENLTFYAVYRARMQTLSFDEMGGWATNDTALITRAYASDDDVTLPTASDVRKYGYDLDGWMEDPTVEVLYAPGSTIKMFGYNATLYAHWVPRTYSVVFDNMGGAWPANGSYTFTGRKDGLNWNSNELLDGVPDPEKTGYTFAGWYTNLDGGSTSAKISNSMLFEAIAPIDLMTGEPIDTDGTVVTLYAKWVESYTQINYYIITPDLQDAPEGGTLTLDSETVRSVYGVPAGTSFTPNAGYDFLYWYDADYQIVYQYTDSAGRTTTVSEDTDPVYESGSTIQKKFEETITPRKRTYNPYLGVYDIWDESNSTWYVVVSPHSYTIKFNMNGGGGSIDPIAMKVGKSLTLDVTTPTRVAYEFLGWNTRSDGLGTMFHNGDVLKNLSLDDGAVVTLYAVWKASEVYVTYEGNATDAVLTSTGIAGSYVEYHNMGDSAYVASANVFTRPGWVLDYWTDDEYGQGTKYYPGATYVVPTVPLTGTIRVFTLYAHWTASTYVIEYEAGTPVFRGSMERQPMTFSYDQSLNPNQFEREGYDFAGWALSVDNANTSIKVNGYPGGYVFEDMEVVRDLTSIAGTVIRMYALWTPKANEVTWFSDDYTRGSVVGPNPAMTVYTGSQPDISVVSWKARDGFKFVGWRYVTTTEWGTTITGTVLSPVDTTINGITYKGVNILGPTEFYALWSYEPAVVYMAGDHGAFNTGKKWGTQFEALTVGQATPEYSGVTEMVKEDDGSSSYRPTGKDGFVFAGWRCASGTNSGTFYAWGTVLPFVEDGTTIYVAEWTSVKNLTFNLNTADQSASWTTSAPSGASGTNDYVLTNQVGDSQITLPGYDAVSRPGYRFTGWGTSPTGFALYAPGGTYTMPAEHTTLYAIYLQYVYAVQFDSDGGAYVAPRGGLYWDSTNFIPSVAPRRDGYRFDGWYTSAGTLIDETSDIATAAEGDDTPRVITLTAHWLDNFVTVYYKVADADGNVTTVGGTVGTASEVLNYGTGVPKGSVAVADVGYHFLGWYQANTLDRNGNVSQQGGCLSTDSAWAPTKAATDYWEDGTTWYARFAPNTYTVTFSGVPLADFDCYGVTHTVTQEFTYDVAQHLTANGGRFTAYGYRFLGWNSDASRAADGLVEYDDYQLVKNILTGASGDDAITLYAVWEEIELPDEPSGGGDGEDAGHYTVKFDGGYDYDLDSAGIQDQEFTIGVYQRITPVGINFRREGYVFIGWNTDYDLAKAGNVQFQDNQRVRNLSLLDGDTVTLYAVWREVVPERYWTVRFDRGTQSDPSSLGLTDQKIEVGVATALKTAYGRYTRDGYTFAGWNHDSTQAAAGVVQVVNGVPLTDRVKVTDLVGEGEMYILYVVWKYVGHTVSYNVNGGSIVSTDSSGNPAVTPETKYYEEGVTVTRARDDQSTGFYRKGYLLVGWDATPNKQGDDPDYDFQSTFVMGNDDVVFYAHWSPITYNVRFHGYGYGDESNAGFVRDTDTGNLRDMVELTGLRYDQLYTMPWNEYIHTGYDFGDWHALTDRLWHHTSDPERYVNSPGWNDYFCFIDNGGTFSNLWSTMEEDGSPHTVDVYLHWIGSNVPIVYESSNTGLGTVSGKSYVFHGDTLDRGEVQTNPIDGYCLDHWEYRMVTDDALKLGLDYESGTLTPNGIYDFVITGPVFFTAVWAPAHVVNYLANDPGYEDGTNFFVDTATAPGTTDAQKKAAVNGQTYFPHVSMDAGTKTPKFAGDTSGSGAPKGKKGMVFAGWKNEDGQVIVTSETTVNGSQHKVYGWDLSGIAVADLPDADGDGVITLIATWAPANATIVFHWNPVPGAVYNETDTMASWYASGTYTQVTSFDTPTQLDPNLFTLNGYRFDAWSYIAGTTQSDRLWADGEVFQLSSAEIAKLRANGSLVLSQDDDGEDVWTMNLYVHWVARTYTVTVDNPYTGGAVNADDPSYLTWDGTLSYYDKLSYRDGKITTTPGYGYAKDNYGLYNWEWVFTLDDGTEVTGTGAVNVVGGKFYDLEGNELSGPVYNGTPCDLTDIRVLGNGFVRPKWERLYSVTFKNGEHGQFEGMAGTYFDNLRAGTSIPEMGYGMPDYDIICERDVDPDNDEPTVTGENRARYLLSYPNLYDWNEFLSDGTNNLNRYLPIGDEGYVFAGWEVDGGYGTTVYHYYPYVSKIDGKSLEEFFGGVYATNPVTNGTIPSYDITVTALWIRGSYTVYFDPNEGAGVIIHNSDGTREEKLAPVKGVAYSPFVTPSKTDVLRPGYVLKSWNTDPDGLGTTYEPNAVYPIPAAITTLYAMWEQQQATIKYTTSNWWVDWDNSDGTLADDQDDQGLNWGDGYAYQTVWAGTGYMVDPLKQNVNEDGYLIDKDGNVLYDDEGNPLTPVNEPGPRAITAYSQLGYHFLHWADESGNIVSTERTFIPPRGADGAYHDATYIAVFTEDDDITITYSVDVADAGWLTRTYEKVAPATGTAVGTYLYIRDGYDFLGFYDGEGNYYGMGTLNTEYGYYEFVPGRASDGIYHDIVYVARFSESATHYVVEYWLQDGSGEYFINESYTASYDAKTGDVITVAADSDLIKPFDTDGVTRIDLSEVSHHLYRPDISTTTITVTADGLSKIKLYYDIGCFTLTYRYVLNGQGIVPADSPIAPTNQPRGLYRNSSVIFDDTADTVGVNGYQFSGWVAYKATDLIGVDYSELWKNYNFSTTTKVDRGQPTNLWNGTEFLNTDGAGGYLVYNGAGNPIPIWANNLELGAFNTTVAYPYDFWMPDDNVIIIGFWEAKGYTVRFNIDTADAAKGDLYDDATTYPTLVPSGSYAYRNGVEMGTYTPRVKDIQIRLLDHNNWINMGWNYTMTKDDGSIETGYTMSPSTIQIMGDTTFTAVFVEPRVMAYMTGSGGSFVQGVDDQTLIQDIPVNTPITTRGYYNGAVDNSVAGYLPISTFAPQGYEGYEFAGWAWRKHIVTVSGGYATVTPDPVMHTNVNLATYNQLILAFDYTPGVYANTMLFDAGVDATAFALGTDLILNEAFPTTVDANYEFVALWTPIRHVFTINENNPDPASITITLDTTKYSSMSSPTNYFDQTGSYAPGYCSRLPLFDYATRSDGWVMDGYSDTPNGDVVYIPGSPYTVGGLDKVIYIHWVPAYPSTIEYAVDSGPYGGVSAGGFVYRESEVVTGVGGAAKGSYAVPNNGYVFVKWVDAAGNTLSSDSTATTFTRTVGTVTYTYQGYKFVPPTPALPNAWPNPSIYYAVFQEAPQITITYIVADPARGTVQLNGGGSPGTMSAESLYPVSGTPLGATVTPNTGYTYGYWVDEDGNKVTMTYTVGGVSHRQLAGMSLVPERVDGAYKSATYYYVFQPSDNISVMVEHYLVDASGTITLAATDTHPYQTTGATVNAVSKGWTRTFSGYYMLTTFQPAGIELVKIEDEVSAMGTTVLRLYYMEYDAQLTFDLAGNLPPAMTAAQMPSYGGANPRSVTSGHTTTLPSAAEVTYAGYTLIGWTDVKPAEGDLTWVYAPGSAYTMPFSDTTLYAIWQPNTNTKYVVYQRRVTSKGKLLFEVKEEHTATTGTRVYANDLSSQYTGYVYTPGYASDAAPSAIVDRNGTTALVMYYVAQPMTIIYDLVASDAGWSYSGVTRVDQYEAGVGITLPTQGDEEGQVYRPGYVLVSWTFDQDGTVYAPGASIPMPGMASRVGTMTATWRARSDTTYTVAYHYVNSDGETVSKVKRTGTTDTTLDASALGLINPPVGWTFDSTNAGNVTTANLNGDGTTILHIYYKPDTVSYTVRHVFLNNVGTMFISETDETRTAEAGKVIHGADVAQTLTGYIWDSTWSYKTADDGFGDSVIRIEVAGDGTSVMLLYYKALMGIDYTVKIYRTNAAYTDIELIDSTEYHDGQVGLTIDVVDAGLHRPSDPRLVGYELDPSFSGATVGGTTYNAYLSSQAITGMGASSDVFYIYYVAKSTTPYTVQHWQLHTDGSSPYMALSVERYGETNSTVYAANELVTFDGFVYSPSETLARYGATDAVIAADGSMVLKIYYMVLAYNLTIDGTTGQFADGTSVIGPTSYATGDVVTIPIPTQIGYDFLGWSVNDPTGAIELLPTLTTWNMPAGNTVLYAHWTPSVRRLAYDNNSTKAQGSVPDTYGVYGGTVKVADPTGLLSRVGYNFGGWATTKALANAGTSDVAVGSNWTLLLDNDDNVVYAVWIPRDDTKYVVYHVRVKSNGELDSPVRYMATENLQGTSDTLATAVAKTFDGYTFDSAYVFNAKFGTNWQANIEADGSTVLYLYYQANVVNYTVYTYRVGADGLVHNGGPGADGTPTGGDPMILRTDVLTGDVDDTVTIDGTTYINLPGYFYYPSYTYTEEGETTPKYKEVRSGVITADGGLELFLFAQARTGIEFEVHHWKENTANPNGFEYIVTIETGEAGVYYDGANYLRQDIIDSGYSYNPTLTATENAANGHVSEGKLDAVDNNTFASTLVLYLYYSANYVQIIWEPVKGTWDSGIAEAAPTFVDPIITPTQGNPGAIRVDDTVTPYNTADIIRYGYQLMGWSTDLNNPAKSSYTSPEYTFATFTMPPSSLRLYAIWQPLPQKITYFANIYPTINPNFVFPGGNGDMTDYGTTPDTWGVTDEEVAVSDNKFTRENYIFVGWDHNPLCDPDSVQFPYRNPDDPDNIPWEKWKLKETDTDPEANYLYAIWKPANVTLEYWSITQDILDAVEADILVNPTRYGYTAKAVAKWTSAQLHRNSKTKAMALDADAIANLGYAPVLIWTKTAAFNAMDWDILYTDLSGGTPVDIRDPELTPINCNLVGWTFNKWRFKQSSGSYLTASTLYSALPDTNPSSGNKRVWATWNEVSVTFHWDVQKTGATTFSTKTKKWFDVGLVDANSKKTVLKGYYLVDGSEYKVKPSAGKVVNSSMSVGDIVYAQKGIYDDTVTDVYIYAQWKAYQYKVTFRTTSTQKSQKSILWEGKLTGASSPKVGSTKKVGGVTYTFVGWFTQPNGGGDQFTKDDLLKNFVKSDTQKSGGTYTFYGYWVDAAGNPGPSTINPSASGSATPLAALTTGSGATALAALSDDSGGGGTALAALSEQDVTAVAVEPLTLAPEPAQDETVAMLALLSEATTDSSMSADAAAGASASAIGQMAAASDDASIALLGVASDTAAVISAADGTSETALSGANAGDAVLAENAIGDASGVGLVALSSDPDSAGGYSPQAEDDAILSAVGSDVLAAAICQLETGASSLAAAINQDALQAAYSTGAAQGLVA
ncbi:MAG: InlB B-repeat-containing protein [Eggerthellaceae bacterium]|nr:InlB B-repeat-containing protein [Eggerthellaceae bacterium]